MLHEATLNATGEPNKHKLCRHLIEEVGKRRFSFCRWFSKTTSHAQDRLPSHTPPQTSALYFDILEMWIYEGIVKDPAAEFMVVGGTDGKRQQVVSRRASLLSVHAVISNLSPILQFTPWRAASTIFSSLTSAYPPFCHR